MGTHGIGARLWSPGDVLYSLIQRIGSVCSDPFAPYQLHERAAETTRRPYPSSAALPTATPHPQPHEQRHHQLNERTEQSWFGLPWFAHPALGAMDVEWSKGRCSIWHAKDGGLEDIPGPVIADGQPKRVAVQPEQHEGRAARQHAKQLLRIKTVIQRKPGNGAARRPQRRW